MSSSNSTGISDDATAYQSVGTLNTIKAVVTMLLVYDALLCIDKEVRYVWQSQKASRRLSRLLYIYNRYMSIVWNILELVAIRKLSNISCTALIWLSAVLAYLSLLGPASFTTLRVYALSGRNKLLTGVVLLLGMGPFLVNVSSLYQRVPINLPPPYGCASEVSMSIIAYFASVIISRSCFIIADTVAVVITWLGTRTTRQASTRVLRRSSLEQILWENGNVYFCTLVALNIADMALTIVTLSITTNFDKAGYVIQLIDPISSILNSRFLLALYETNAYIERGDTSSSSFPTLGSDRADPSAAGSPGELPEYLNSLGGPIYSIPDHDTELFDLELTTVHPIPEV